MVLDDEIRKCSEKVEEIRSAVDEVKRRGRADRHLSQFEKQIERLSSEARDAVRKLDAGVREGLERFVETWRETQKRVSGELRLIEAKTFLLSAQRLAGEGDFVAAENEVEAAVRDAQEAAALLPDQDGRLKSLGEEIQQVVADLRSQAASASARIDEAVSQAERLLDELVAGA